MIIFGWMRRFTILGVKLDQCETCGRVCEHVVGRKTNWGHVFWVPVLFLGWEHGMACTTCHSWTGIPWQQVRAAMKTGSLRLDRSRPAGAELVRTGAGEGLPPVHVGAVFDRLLVNPKRGAFDLYVKAWPVIVSVLVLAGAVSSASKAPPTYGSSAPTYGGAPALYDVPGQAGHQCWADPAGAINGCRLSTGAIYGSASGTPITCYFVDGDLATADTIRCDR